MLNGLFFLFENGIFEQNHWYFATIKNLQLKLCPLIIGIFAVHASNLLALLFHRSLTTFECEFSFDSIIWKNSLIRSKQPYQGHLGVIWRSNRGEGPCWKFASIFSQLSPAFYERIILNSKIWYHQLISGVKMFHAEF